MSGCDVAREIDHNVFSRDHRWGRHVLALSWLESLVALRVGLRLIRLIPIALVAISLVAIALLLLVALALLGVSLILLLEALTLLLLEALVLVALLRVPLDRLCFNGLDDLRIAPIVVHEWLLPV